MFILAKLINFVSKLYYCWESLGCRATAIVTTALPLVAEGLGILLPRMLLLASFVPIVLRYIVFFFFSAEGVHILFNDLSSLQSMTGQFERLLNIA